MFLRETVYNNKRKYINLPFNTVNIMFYMCLYVLSNDENIKYVHFYWKSPNSKAALDLTSPDFTVKHTREEGVQWRRQGVQWRRESTIKKIRVNIDGSTSNHRSRCTFT